MAVTKQKKEVLLSKAQDIFANNATTVFVEAKGMLVNDINNIRKKMNIEKELKTDNKKWWQKIWKD